MEFVQCCIQGYIFQASIMADNICNSAGYDWIVGELYIVARANIPA